MVAHHGRDFLVACSPDKVLYFLAIIFFPFIVCIPHIPLLYYKRAYLAVPATSVPVERLFSVSGNVISPKRTRLTDGAASDLIVLHQPWATCAALLPGFVQSHLPEEEKTPAKRARPSLPLGA